MRYLVASCMIMFSLAQCTSNAFASSLKCERARKAVYNEVIKTDGEDLDSALEDAQSFMRSPERFTFMVCGDVFTSADPQDRGNVLCNAEMRACK